MADGKVKIVNGYQILSRIGKGSYGRIYKVTRDGHTLALKKIDMTTLSAEEQTDTLNEVSLMGQLDNEHIVRFYDAFMDNGNMYIVMELLSGGDLGDILRGIKSGKPLAEEEVWHLLIESCCGLKYLHDRRMLHRDLKPQNIMLDSQGHVKLVDFGFTKLLGTNQLAMSVVGTPLYMSPELLIKRGYDDRTDVWSLGCIFHELLTCAPPFPGANWEQLTYNILNEAPAIPIPKTYSNDLVTVIGRMLIKNPEERPSIREIMKMPEFLPHFLKLKTVDPFEEDEVEIWHEVTNGISPQITGRRIMAAQFTWFVRKLAESRRHCKNLEEQLDHANAEIASLKEAAAASAPRESIGVDLGDSKDQYRPKKLVFRKEYGNDSGSEESSDSGSDSDDSKRVTAMMGNMQLATPQTHAHPAATTRATDKRLASVASSSTSTGTPMKSGKSSSKLIPFSPDHFGLVPLLASDNTVNALFAWQKQEKPTDKRILCSPVWDNKGNAKLLTPSSHIIVFVRTPSGSAHSASTRKMYLKAVYAGYAGEETMMRIHISPEDTRPLPVLGQQPDRSVWYYVPIQGKSEIRDIRLEFESANLATEVVIVRANRLLDVITRKEKDLSKISSRDTVGNPPVNSSSGGKNSTHGDEISDMESLTKMKDDFMRTTTLLAETTRGLKPSDSSETH